MKEKQHLYYTLVRKNKTVNGSQVTNYHDYHCYIKHQSGVKIQPQVGGLYQLDLSTLEVSLGIQSSLPFHKTYSSRGATRVVSSDLSQ